LEEFEMLWVGHLVAAPCQPTSSRHHGRRASASAAGALGAQKQKNGRRKQGSACALG
jgi:hypothetical protein